MMFSRIFAKKNVTTPSPRVVTATVSPEQIQYPPVDPGINLQTVQELVASNADILDRLQLHAAQSGAGFQTRFLDPASRLADVVNCLPATATDHFSAQGGLLRASVEMGFQSFQAADGRIFTGKESVEQRHALEGRWRYTSYLIGLLYPIGIPLDIVSVTDSTGKNWRKQLQGLTAWADANSVKRIYVNWPASGIGDAPLIGPSPSVTAHIQHIVGIENLQWLEDGSPEFVKMLYGIASGQKVTGTPMAGLITEMWLRILQREQKRRPLNYGRVVAGTHIGPYLIGTMRDLVSSGKWRINADELRVDQHGVYLIWPDAARSIIAYGIEKQYPGWPNDASTIEALLKSTGIVIQEQGSLGYREVVDDEGCIRQALQVNDPMSLIADYEPQDYVKKAKQTLDAARHADPLGKTQHSKVDAKSAQGAVDGDKQLADNQSDHNADAPPVVSQAQVKESVEPSDSQPGVSRIDGGDLQSSSQPKAKGSDEGVATKRASKQGDGEKAAAEVPDVRFADLLSTEVKKQFKNPLISEVLGKIVKTARTESLARDHMRMTENGLAVQRKFLQDNVRDVNVWLDAMSNAGFLYTDPSTPGRKIYEVAIPQGAKPSTAIILSRLAVKKLDL